MFRQTRRIGLMMRMALALFVLVAANRPTLGQEIKIVVPNALENVEGDVDGTTSTTPFRWQQLAPASEFATLPETHRTIIGAFWRPDRTVTEPRTVVLDDDLLRLSTTSKTLADLDTAFDENVGDDVTTVFEGSITASTQATGPPEGPRGFDYFLKFDTPFVYDPDAGSLLMDGISFSGQVPTLNEDFDSSVAAVWNSNPNASTGTRLSGSVVQLVFVASDPLLGDLNLDGEINGLDVDPFVEVLLSGPYQTEADMNEDQVVNGLDVDPFVAAVVGDGVQQIPEPSTLLLGIVALGVVGIWRKWRR